MTSASIENITTRMHGNSHSSIIGLLSSKFTALDIYDYIKDNEESLWERLNLAYENTENKK